MISEKQRQPSSESASIITLTAKWKIFRWSAVLVSAATLNQSLKIMHNEGQKERDGLEGDRWPRVRERPLAFRWRRLQKTLPVCLFAALSVMWFVAFRQRFLYLLLFVFHCLTGSNVSNPITFTRSRWTPGFSSPECKTVWFLSGSQAVTHHDWPKEKSALSPLLNMNNKSVHPRSPFTLHRVSLTPAFTLTFSHFVFVSSVLPSYGNRGPTLHVFFFFFIGFARSLSCESHRLDRLALLERQLKLNLAQLWEKQSPPQVSG